MRASSFSRMVRTSSDEASSIEIDESSCVNAESMCIRNYAGQSAIDVRKTEELHMLASNLPVAVVVFKPSATPTMRIEKIGVTAHSARCEECEP